MRDRDAQLSFVDAPRVVVRWHRMVSPPDSIGPFDTAAFEAALATSPELSGWGRTEESAIAALADRLCRLVGGRSAANELTALGQVLVAAQRLGPDELARWLAERAEELQLAEA
jgi:hypothetical protein